ncbi:hypothetical protein ACQ4M3_41415 [Leptolyngbya sp. AN03gr2]|uniref:hypothetical protein n=1 Tax=unclassified Leptolyngbya TaxID=2650499 RepID=UPI003D31AB55
MAIIRVSSCIPPTEEAVYSGILACLRDLAFGWTADMLYILTPNSTSAEAVRSLCTTWNCSEVTVYSPERTHYLTFGSGILLSMRWQVPPDSRQDPNYDQLYLDNLDARFDSTRSLQQASAQSLVTALVRRGKFGKFDPQLVLSDLEKHRSRWRSFIFGPPLPEANVDLEFCLESLSYLP